VRSRSPIGAIGVEIVPRRSRRDGRAQRPHQQTHDALSSGQMSVYRLSNVLSPRSLALVDASETSFLRLQARPNPNLIASAISPGSLARLRHDDCGSHAGAQCDAIGHLVDGDADGNALRQPHPIAFSRSVMARATLCTCP
jgi:hypothetical protein